MNRTPPDQFSKFRNQVTSACNAEHSACPSTSKSDETVMTQIRDPVYKNGLVTISDLVNKVGSSFDHVKA
jgi:hypothetical protein